MLTVDPGTDFQGFGKMFRRLLTAAVVLGVAAAVPAQAGNIVLTGHDNDLHKTSDAFAQVVASIKLIRNGSLLPLLTFDAGTQLTSLLATIGVAFTNINPSVAASITDALFSNALYSGFAVASQQTCGGCDNSAAGVANIATHAAAIANFFNAGGGIYGLTSGLDPLGYAYVPQTASNPGGTPDAFNHVTTAAGLALGIPAVNGDKTHNFFSAPGSSGLSSLYQVVETQGEGGRALTVALTNGKIDGGVITTGGSTPVPEPASIAVLGFGLLGLRIAQRRAFWIRLMR